MSYKEIINAIYMQLINRPGFDMCGPQSNKAILELNNILEQQELSAHDNHIDIEGLISDGFAENAENGFYYGFQCASNLLMGKNDFGALVRKLVPSINEELEKMLIQGGMSNIMQYSDTDIQEK